MDLNGFSDPYIKLYMLGIKEKEKIGEVRTKTIKKTLNPVWNEEYHFPIKSLRTDVLHISLKDYDKMKKDDGISTYDLHICSLPLGKVVDEWLDFTPVKKVKKGGKVHVKYHLASPGSLAFIEKPFQSKTLNIKIIEAKDVKAMNLKGLADPYCVLSIVGDRTFLTTAIKYGTLSPLWNETFYLLIGNYETDVFKLELKDKNKLIDSVIGSASLELNKFEVGKIYKKWIEVKYKGKKTGLIKVEINVTNTGDPDFIGNIIEEKGEMPVSSQWEINLHLIKASNLPFADSNGLSDPYCVFSILNTKISKKSRRIDKSLNPEWDDYFSIPIQSLNSDVLRIEVIDWDKIGKHKKLCKKDFIIKDYNPGSVYHSTYTLIPFYGYWNDSTIELSFQITPPGVTPFKECPYSPEQINIRIEDIKEVTTKISKPNPYFNIKLEADTNEGVKSIIKDKLNAIIKETFSFIITDKTKDKLVIEYKNENDNKLLGKAIIPLLGFKNEITEELNLKMEPKGNIHLFLEINKKNNIPFKDIIKKNNIPFKDIKLSQISNPYMTLYFLVTSGSGIPATDKTGLSDPFCVLELLNRNDKKKTSIKKQTLSPIWNQEFEFKILSYNTDVFCLSLFDYDKYSKNELLGKWEIPIKDMELGIVEEREIEAGGFIHVKYQLACANQCKWENKESKPMKLNVKVIEAKDFPNNSSKTDPYLELFFTNDTIKQKTKIMDNNSTPQ